MYGVVYGVLGLLWLAVIVLGSAWPVDEKTPRQPARPPRRIPLPQLAEWNPELSTAELVRLQELEFIMAEDDYQMGLEQSSWPQIHGWHAGHTRWFGWHVARHS